jgi:hypothetical protein
MKELLSFLLTYLLYLFYTIVFSFIFGLIIWPCWNFVMPLLGVGKITYLGACCIYILAKILMSPVNLKS